jgi:transketolase C-terminal domain/subunit
MQLRDLLFKELFETRNLSPLIVNNDYSSPYLDKIKAINPKAVLNVGIAEQSMVSVAAGLRAGDIFSVCYSISTFLFSRANEQIKIDFLAQDLPFLFIAMGPGFDYPEDGPSHHSIEELSITFTYPKTKLLNPITEHCIKRFVPSDDKLLSGRYIYSLLRKQPSSESIDTLASAFQATDFGYLSESSNSSTLIICHGYTAHQALLHLKQIQFAAADVAISIDLKAPLSTSKTYNKYIIWSESLIGSGFHAHHSQLIRNQHGLVNINHVGVDPELVTPFYGTRHMHELKYFYGIDSVLASINL